VAGLSQEGAFYFVDKYLLINAKAREKELYLLFII
jgi:hypothetical protein